MEASVTPLEIACAKPNCMWKGPPSEAATHPCPTPATASTAEVTITNATGLEILPNGTGDEVERQQIIAALEAAGVTFNHRMPLPGLRELYATFGGGPLDREMPVAPQGVAADADPPYGDDSGPELELDADAEPETFQELSAWLEAHGKYDDQGVPQDEKTARLDARYAVELEQQEPADDEQDDGEPELAPRYWQVAIAEQLAEQPEPDQYRWAVVVHYNEAAGEIARDATLLGRGARKAEATVIAEDAIARGTLTGEIKVHKIADILADAERLGAHEVERRRENVQEPDTAIETPDEPPEPEPAEGEPETSPEPPDKPTPKGALFDASDYDREDLALPKIDGHPIDRIAIGFTGEVMLDRSNPDHVQLWRRLKLGRDVELWIEAKGVGVTTKGATNREGDLDVVVGKRNVAVQTVRILGPEDLENAADEIVAQAREELEQQADRDRLDDAA